VKTKRSKSRLPGVTEDGFLDPAQFPIAPVLKQALSDDRQEFHSAVSVLRSMYNYDRKEAGVFLIGLLLTCGGDWEKRRAVATALYDVQTEVCVNVLFGELRRVKNTNSTRRYLKEVIDVLSCMPPALVRPGFEELANDKCFTPRMRAKFEAVRDYVAYWDENGYP
jgi:hypothetical protein